MVSTEKLLFFIIIVFIGNKIHSAYEFNRDLTGVSFSPYVKTLGSNKTASCVNQYTFGELTTMLEVISTKFSKVVTESMDAFDVKYIPNATYYNNACIIVRTAEAAAVINRKHGRNIFSVIIGIKNYDEQDGGDLRTETEVNLAMEAFRIANSIYPRTVEGFQFSDVFSHAHSFSSGARWIHYLRNKMNDSGLRIGISATLSDLQAMDLPLNAFDLQDNSSISRNPTWALIAKLDFVTCKFFADQKQAINGPSQSFVFISTFFIMYKNIFKRLNRNIIAMGCTGWVSAGNHSFQTVTNLQEYWIAANEFACNNEYPMWFHEAFDNPWKINLKQDSPYYGWWRLNENGEADNLTSYKENILNPRNITFANTKTLVKDPVAEDTDNIWVWTGIATGFGGLILVVLCVGLFKLYKMKSSLQSFILSRQEIREFKFGSSSYEMEQYGCHVYGSAMQKPYDRSLEVPKDKLEIYWDQILGTGQFGCVHKAIIKGEDSKDIAVKTTKVTCRPSALRGLLSEIKILTHLGYHPNIVSICGAYTAELTKGRVFVALELCTMGSLKKHLCRFNETDWSEETENSRLQDNMFRWSSEICSGMEHIGKKGVIHADLAARNVLLTNDYTAKVADFGLSRRLYEYDKYVKRGDEPVPWRWMSIESLKMRQFSCQSDVWSFGVTLWEIFSLGTDPYPGYVFNASFVEDLENGSATMSRPREASEEVYRIMLDCWHLDPSLRPTFANLKTRILELRAANNYDVLVDDA